MKLPYGKLLALTFDASGKASGRGRDLAISATDDAPEMLCSAFAHSCLLHSSPVHLHQLELPERCLSSV